MEKETTHTYNSNKTLSTKKTSFFLFFNQLSATDQPANYLILSPELSVKSKDLAKHLT